MVVTINLPCRLKRSNGELGAPTCHLVGEPSVLSLANVGQHHSWHKVRSEQT